MTAGRIAPSYSYFKFTTDRISVTPLLVGRPDSLTWKEAIEPQLEMAELIGFDRGTVLLTFTVISRCCSSGVQIALKPCREYLDAGHQVWHFLESTYQVTNDLYISQLEEQMTHLQMGNQETATDFCNRARRLLARMRMSGVQYSMALYVTHVLKGLRSSYNLMKRLPVVPSTRATFNDDSLTSYILRDEATQEAKRSMELLPQVNYAATAKQGGTKEVFVDLQLSGDVKHVRGFNGALQDVQGRSTVALQGKAEKQVPIPDMLYVSGLHVNLQSAGQLKENGVRLQEDGDEMLLISAAGDVLGRASYTGLVLCTDLRPFLAKSTSPTTEVVALRAIVSATKSTPDRLHARLAHIGMDTIRRSAKHEVATRLDLKSASGADSQCVSCVGGKLARHTFPDQGSDADEVLAVVHIDLCGPFRVAAKDSSLYFLLLKNRKARYLWVRLIAKKSDTLQEFVEWLAVAERQTKKSVLMLRSDQGGEFLGKDFTAFVNGKGIVHDLTCPYTPQQNRMAERELRTVVESVRTMLLHMGVQHHWWHLALRQAVRVRNCLERSTLPTGTTPYQLLTGKKPDLSLAWVWGCMEQFLVLEQHRGGKLKPKAKSGLDIGVSEESKGWELLDIADNWVVTTSDVVFYEKFSLELWKSEHGPASGQTPTTPPTEPHVCQQPSHSSLAAARWAGPRAPFADAR
ncbi:unnamed protein product [Closterium sp. NIES-53]